jgi:hypothetical protein
VIRGRTIALQIGERNAPADRQVADRPFLASDQGSVLRGNLLQGDGRLLVKPADMRLREPGGECRKVRLLDRAKLELRRCRAVQGFLRQLIAAYFILDMDTVVDRIL